MISAAAAAASKFLFRKIESGISAIDNDTF